MQDFLVGMGDTLFLSTPSARRATQGSRPDRQAHAISIHALREEGDVQDFLVGMGDTLFLSTPSARRATQGSRPDRQAHAISIHALREEGDAHLCSQWLHPVYFYPRPPRGGRRRQPGTKPRLFLFLSTPSARRATRERAHDPKATYISIHALREEGDTNKRVFTLRLSDISIHALREEGDTARWPKRAQS